MGLIIRLLISSLAIFITSKILPAIQIKDLGTAIVVAIVLGLINTFVKPILNFFAFPITIITLGLFSLIINAVVVMLTDYLVEGFSVPNLMWALIFAVVLSIINTVLIKIVE